jgi:hypothetical protein
VKGKIRIVRDVFPAINFEQHFKLAEHGTEHIYVGPRW